MIRKTSHVHYSYTKVFLFFKTDANAMVFAELLPLLLLVLNLRTKILILTKNLTKDLRMASEELSKGGSAEEVQVFSICWFKAPARAVSALTSFDV